MTGVCIDGDDIERNEKDHMDDCLPQQVVASLVPLIIDIALDYRLLEHIVIRALVKRVKEVKALLTSISHLHWDRPRCNLSLVHVTAGGLLLELTLAYNVFIME